MKHVYEEIFMDRRWHVESTISKAVHCLVEHWFFSQQQQFPVWSRLRGIWGDPPVGGLTLVSISTHKEVDSNSDANNITHGFQHIYSRLLLHQLIDAPSNNTYINWWQPRNKKKTKWNSMYHYLWNKNKFNLAFTLLFLKKFMLSWCNWRLTHNTDRSELDLSHSLIITLPKASDRYKYSGKSISSICSLNSLLFVKLVRK